MLFSVGHHGTAVVNVVMGQICRPNVQNFLHGAVRRRARARAAGAKRTRYRVRRTWLQLLVSRSIKASKASDTGLSEARARMLGARRIPCHRGGDEDPIASILTLFLEDDSYTM